MLKLNFVTGRGLYTNNTNRMNLARSFYAKFFAQGLAPPFFEFGHFEWIYHPLHINQ